MYMFNFFCLQHARISIKAMMQSPFLGDLAQEVEYWHSALQQIEEITDLWCNCQKKVNNRIETVRKRYFILYYRRHEVALLFPIMKDIIQTYR